MVFGIDANSHVGFSIDCYECILVMVAAMKKMIGLNLWNVHTALRLCSKSYDL